MPKSSKLQKPPDLAFKLPTSASEVAKMVSDIMSTSDKPVRHNRDAKRRKKTSGAELS